MQPSDPNQLAMQQNQQQPQINPDAIGLAQQQSQARERQIQQEGQLGQQNQQNSQAAVSQAMAMLNPQANSGDKTANTMSKVGQAINPSSQWANMCEAFAEQQIHGRTGIYPTAYAAYQDNASKGNVKTSTNNIPANSQVFMAPDSSNGNSGHTGVMQSNGKFLAPLSNGSIEEFSIPEWEKFSGQKFLGWSPPPSSK